jgi:hypothetical protein
MFTNAKLALCAAAVLGSASAAQTAPQHPTIRQTESIVQHQVSRSASGTIASRQHRGKARTRTPYSSIRARHH